MSYSVDPPQLIGLAERMRRSFDDVSEVATALHQAVNSASLALTRAAPAHAAFVEVAEGRVSLAHRIVARGRAALSALQTVVLTYLSADREMARATDAASARVTPEPNPFDPGSFGRGRR